MGVWPEVMRLVDGHLFDAESYERSELLDASLASAAGYYVVVWSSDVGRGRQDERPQFVGPFPSPDVASGVANKLIIDTVSRPPP